MKHCPANMQKVTHDADSTLESTTSLAIMSQHVMVLLVIYNLRNVISCFGFFLWL